MTFDAIIQRYRYLLAAVFAFIAAMALTQLPPQFNSSPVQRTVTIAGSDVQVEVDRDRIMLPWDCALVAVTWDEDAIEAVTAAGLPLENGKIQRICYWGASMNADLAITAADGSVVFFPQPIRIGLFEPLALFWIGVSMITGTLALYLAGIGTTKTTSAVEAPSRRRMTLKGVAQGFWLLNSVLFCMAMLIIMLEGGGAAAFIFLVVAVLAILGGMHRVQARAAVWIQRREFFVLPLVWYILTVAVLDIGMKTMPESERLWAAIQTWSAGVFVWLSLYWLASYFARRFEMNPVRRKHWLIIAGAVMLASIAGIALIFIRAPDWSHWTFGVPDVGVLIYRSSDQSPDVLYGYAPYAQTFPFGWRAAKAPLQRPILPMIASEVCMTMDILVTGYDDGLMGCNAITTVWVAYYVMNIIMMLVCMLLIYELIRLYLDSPYAALLGTLLAILMPLNVWFVSIASTDYTDFVIPITSLWIFHHLFTARAPAWRYNLLAGLVFGIFLVLKLNLVHLIFGMALVLYLRRWDALMGLIGIPVLVFAFYRVLLVLFGVEYIVAETEGWRTVTWLYTELIFYKHPYSIVRSLTHWFGVAADRAALLCGMLLVFGGYVMFTDTRYPRYLLALGWTMFLAIALFLWVFQYPYINLLIGLLPFIFGAVGLGLEGIQTRIQAKYPNTLMRRLLIAGVLFIPFAHQILYWFGWTIRHYINFDYFIG